MRTKQKAVKGVRKVVEVPSGVAVIADGFWAAKRGRDALQIEWDEGPMADFNSKSQRQQYAELASPSLRALNPGCFASSAYCWRCDLLLKSAMGPSSHSICKASRPRLAAQKPSAIT